MPEYTNRCPFCAEPILREGVWTLLIELGERGQRIRVCPSCHGRWVERAPKAGADGKRGLR